jgi:hypothetical protein
MANKYGLTNTTTIIISCVSVSTLQKIKKALSGRERVILFIYPGADKCTALDLLLMY